MPTLVNTDPADHHQVKGETRVLPSPAEHGWDPTTALHGVSPEGAFGVPCPGALDPGTVVVRRNGRVLQPGSDYRLDESWGSIAIGPDPSFPPGEAVTIDYSYSHLRLDSVVRLPSGETELRRGLSHISVPEPPPVRRGEKRLANVWVPYRNNGRGELFPILERPSMARVRTTSPARVPRTLDRLQRGSQVRIVCWGDSVTEGGDASTPQRAFPTALEQRLRQVFPTAEVAVHTVAVGGSSSAQWFSDVDWPRHARATECRFERIEEVDPHLVAIEFVNDHRYGPELFEALYGRIVDRLQARGAEIILITPHFTNFELMNFTHLRQRESRAYVSWLVELAERRRLGLADASARWEHLWLEGLPYMTLLRNGINHPDDRGHAIFTDELMRSLAGGPVPLPAARGQRRYFHGKENQSGRA